MDRLQHAVRLLLLLWVAAALGACESDKDDSVAANPGTPAPPQPIAAALAWDAATGPVTGYRIFEAWDGEDFAAGQDVDDVSVRLEGMPGQTLRVRVAALDPEGEIGPLSEPSRLLSFTAGGVEIMPEVLALTGGDPEPALPEAAANPLEFSAASFGDPPDTSLADASDSTLEDASDADASDSTLADASGADASDSTGQPAEDTGEHQLAAIRDEMSGDAASDLLWESVAEGLLRVTAVDLQPHAVFERPESGWELAGRADFDGDGLTDLLWVQQSGALGLSRMDRLLELQPSADLVDLGALGADDVILATGDLDGDGSAELVVQDAHTGALSFWSVAADATPVAVPVGLIPGPGEALVGSRDYDGNAVDDLLFQGSDGVLTLWLLDAAGLQRLTSLDAELAGGEVIASGDFDSDGVADVLRRNAAGAMELLLLGKPSGAPVVTTDLPAATGLAWAGVGDYDADGSPDLLWQDETGSLVLWFFDLAAGIETVVLPSEPDWSLVFDWR